MARLPFRISAVLAVLCTAIPVAGAMPAQAVPLRLYGSCRQVHQLIPAAPDGTYLLYNNNILFTAYCHDMATNPSEYVDLADTGPDINFSQYTAGGASPGTSVRTAFTKLRVDPATLTVDIGDLAFASSTGSLRHGSTTVTSMPYGVAMSCTARADGVADIDLRDTPFRVDDAFAAGGFNAAGTATVSPAGQTVDLRGGGYCGWEMPVPVRYNPFNPSPGAYNLTLACAQNGVVRARLQVCLRLSNPAALTMRTRRIAGRPVVIVRHDGREVAALRPDGRIHSVT